MRCKPNIFESSVFTRLVRLCLILSEKLKKNKNIIKKINKFKFITTINENKKTRKKNNYRQYNFASFHNNYEFDFKERKRRTKKNTDIIKNSQINIKRKI